MVVVVIIIFSLFIEVDKNDVRRETKRNQARLTCDD